jgi:hypothetical protein
VRGREASDNAISHLALLRLCVCVCVCVPFCVCPYLCLYVCLRLCVWVGGSGPQNMDGIYYDSVKRYINDYGDMEAANAAESMVHGPLATAHCVCLCVGGWVLEPGREDQQLTLGGGRRAWRRW